MISKHQVLETLVRDPKRPAAFQQAFAQHIDPVQGWLTEPEAFLLWSLSGTVSADLAVVEIGSYLGRSTVALATGSRGALVHAVDPHTGDISEVAEGKSINTYEGFLANIDKASVSDRVRPMRMMSVDAAAIYEGPAIGLLFVDGWHSAEAVEEDIRSWHPHLAPQCTIVFDDWQDPDVARGIRNIRPLIPSLVGSIGKDLIFTSSTAAARLPIVRNAAIHERAQHVAARLRLTEDIRVAFR
ncbi:MAG TPA: hypothetical protein DDY88_04290 [Actinobacteria bacterium]|nr:hypothetical protein [Actinomycetota bacterium]